MFSERCILTTYFVIIPYLFYLEYLKNYSFCYKNLNKPELCILILRCHFPRMEGILNSVSLGALSPQVSGKMQGTLEAVPSWQTICSISHSRGGKTKWPLLSED